MTPVTKSFLPPINDYIQFVQRAYNNGWITNRGELVVELEQKLSHFLLLKETKLICMNNGTTPLQIALKVLGNGGEIITTPFSYVATTSSIVWEGCTPVFIDIHPEYLTIDETKIEEAITDKTTCILATHVFGNPCNVEVIEKIAVKNDLKVIYDGAHCFGVKYKGKSIFEYGDVSTCSFHATKVFHTGEGGGVFCKNNELYEKIFFSHNFGHNGSYEFHGIGINGKMSELGAAMGLSVFQNLDYIFTSRKKVVEYYNSNLNTFKIKKIKLREGSSWNYSYYPIIFESENILLTSLIRLNEIEVYPRRYFYPSLNTISYVEYCEMPISESISSRILCLPLYDSINEEELEKITNILNEL